MMLYISLGVKKLWSYDIIMLCFAKSLYGTMQASECLFLSQEGGDVKHTGTLALTDQCQTEGIHHITQLILLFLHPFHDNGLLTFHGEVVDAFQHVSKLRELCGRIFLPAFLHRFLVILCGSNEEERT